MPGMYGSAGCPPEGFESIAAEYASAWGGQSCEEIATGSGALGGHAFGEGRALHSTREHHLAVDGGVHAYRAVPRWIDAARDSVAELEDGFLEPHPELTGNVAAVDRRSGVLHLARDWAGSFPLFYAEWRGGLLFANLLRPLAGVVRPDLDRLGLIQFLRRGYVLGDRTPFRSIRRVRPGEVLRFEPDSGGLSIDDRSELWVGPRLTEDDRPARVCLEALRRSLRSALEAADRPAVMMSGGWDSRTLLAACADAGPGGRAPVLGYSHGDVEGRELGLVRRLCDEVGAPCHLEPIDDRIFDVPRLRRDFAKTGTSVFPHWQWSGHALAGLGRSSAMAGIFGEVPGGHYGRTMAAGGLGKALSLVRQVLPGLGRRPGGGDPGEEAFGALRVESVRRDDHWYLDPDFDRSIPQKKERINGDLRSVLRRYRERGLETTDRLIEACISEHRGSQYIAAQTVSARAAVDPSLPFADRSLLHAASRVAPRLKVHNALNREMLGSIGASLLDHPMAATLVPAKLPILAQEASRAARKAWESLRWRGYFASDGALPPPRLGWVNFEFLRDSRPFEDLVDDLEADIWDVGAIRGRIERAREGEHHNRLHPLFDQFGKLYTVDRLLA